MIQITPTPAPDSVMNLRLDVVYAPKVRVGPFIGYMCTERILGAFEVSGYQEDGTGVILYQGELFQAYRELVRCLGVRGLGTPRPDERRHGYVRRWRADAPDLRPEKPIEMVPMPKTVREMLDLLHRWAAHPDNG